MCCKGTLVELLDGAAVTLLAIDPGRSYKGEQTIGLSYWHHDKELWRRSVSFEELVQMLDVELDGDEELTLWINGYPVDEVVIENFVNDPQSARGGQQNGTSECIGAVEYACIKARRPFTRQPSTTLGPAKLHAPEGSWKKLKHLRHEDSAYLHGYEYLVGKGVLQSAGLSSTL